MLIHIGLAAFLLKNKYGIRQSNERTQAAIFFHVSSVLSLVCSPSLNQQIISKQFKKDLSLESSLLKLLIENQ